MYYLRRRETFYSVGNSLRKSQYLVTGDDGEYYIHDTEKTVYSDAEILDLIRKYGNDILEFELVEI